ncbi:Conserved_hypothetical protein [Hexamita inflata]|uniref:Uncharacterized protein n=1 Tax=Hexamita inflata TaxID=28002 RepID=A0AA86NUS3_9EUKA|nr:Conserved hypothetical protein [Hexamita inflata]
MPYPSIFYSPKIDKVVLEDCINCVASEKPKLRAIDEQRKIMLKQLHDDKCDCEQLLEACDRYLTLYASYAKYCETVNAKNDQEELLAIFKKVPQYVHRSLVNEKDAKFTESKMEQYLILFDIVTIMLDLQFKLSAANANADVLTQQNNQLKRALGILSHLKTLSQSIVIDAKNVSDTAIELRADLLDNISNVIRGMFCINSADKGIKMNEAALKADEPPKYSLDVLAGLARTAENSFKQATQQLETLFKQDLKNISKNYVSFVSSMYVMSQLYKYELIFGHFYEISNDLSEKQATVEEAEHQKKACARELKKALEKFQTIRVKSAGVDEWFAIRFESHIERMVKISTRCNGTEAAMVKELGNTVEIKGTDYVAAEAIWDTMSVIGPKKK